MQFHLMVISIILKTLTCVKDYGIALADCEKGGFD